MTPWPQVLEKLQGRAFDSFADMVAFAEHHRGARVTTDSLGAAWRRHGLPGQPGVLVGGLWEGEQTVPDSRTQNISNNVYPDLHQKPPRPSIRIPAPNGVVAVLGDLHFPIHDKRAVDCTFELLTQLPNLAAVILQGDTLDFVWASRFMTEAERIHQGAFLVDEIAAARPFLEALTGLCDVHYIEGNHEGKRRDELINENPWLYSHPAVDPASLLMLPDGIELHPWRSRLRWDCVTVEHGDKLKGAASVYGMRKVLNTHSARQPGESVHVYGHTHRLGSWRESYYDEEGRPFTKLVANCGHLSDLRYHGYSNDSNWQHGLVLLCPLGGGSWDAQCVEVKGGRCSYGGRIYGA